MSLSLIFYAALLAVAGFVLLFFEIILPSMGVLTVLALAAFIGAVWVGFLISPLTAGLMVAALLLVAPLYIIAMSRILPNTRFGRRMFLGKAPDATGSGAPDALASADLIGQTGVALTQLRPSGAVRVAGRRIIAVTEGGLIDEGATVKVISATGSNIMVREVTERPPEKK